LKARSRWVNWLQRGAGAVLIGFGVKLVVH
jgi:threonine/homoserine/homoserine lactone efflux protein